MRQIRHNQLLIETQLRKQEFKPTSESGNDQNLTDYVENYGIISNSPQTGDVSRKIPSFSVSRQL